MIGFKSLTIALPIIVLLNLLSPSLPFNLLTPKTSPLHVLKSTVDRYDGAKAMVTNKLTSITIDEDFAEVVGEYAVSEL